MTDTSSTALPRTLSPSLFLFTTIYGGMVVLAGVLGTKLASLGTWPLLGSLAVESGIFAFLLLVVISSAVAELYGKQTADRLVRLGFIPLIMSMILLMTVIHVVPPAAFWHDQESFARILGQGARLQFAGLIAYGISQTLNVAIFSKLTSSTGGSGKLLWFRALVAGMLSQIVDTILFVTIAFYGAIDKVTGQPYPVTQIMTGQIISKMVLSALLVPVLIYAFVALGRWVDRREGKVE
jgi:uncharacterized integral membrane protein (TIGR00697 family)